MTGSDGCTAEQLRFAETQAQLSADATEAIEQAGRGLALCHSQCKSNTPTTDTISNLIEVQDYVHCALRALLARQLARPLTEPPVPTIVLAGG